MNSGRWQQWLLGQLAGSPLVIVSEAAVQCAGGSLTRSEYNALLRAARTLARRGEVGLMRAASEDCRGQSNVRLVAVRPEAVEQLRCEGANVVCGPNGTVTPQGRRLRGSMRAVGELVGVSKSTVQRVAARAAAGNGNAGGDG